MFAWFGVWVALLISFSICFLAFAGVTETCFVLVLLFSTFLCFLFDLVFSVDSARNYPPLYIYIYICIYICVCVTDF